MPLSTRPPPPFPVGLEGPAAFASVADKPQMFANPKVPSIQGVAAGSTSDRLLEHRLQLCSPGDICLLQGTAGALASSDLQPQQLLQLCQSLPLDVLNDMPPALLLLLHEQQQQQEQQHQDASSLLLALAVAMERHCNVTSGRPAASPAAAAAPELAVAILHAEKKILSQLRQALLEPLTGCTDCPGIYDAAVAGATRHAAMLLRLSRFTTSHPSHQHQGQLAIEQLQRLGSTNCSCLRLSSDPHSLLSPVLAAALEHHVLLLHPQALPLVSGLLAVAADVAVLLHWNSSSTTSSSSAFWCPLTEEQQLHAGRQLREAATQIFPPECFQLQHQPRQPPRDGSLKKLLSEAPKDGARLPAASPSPMLVDRPLTDRQDAWLDVLHQLLLLLPPGRPRLDWLVASELDGLLLHLLFQSSLPLCRPLLLPLLLDSCGAQVQLQPSELLPSLQQQQHLQYQQQEQPVYQKLSFAAAAAGALASGLQMAASLKLLQGFVAAEQQGAAGRIAFLSTNDLPAEATSLPSSSSNSTQGCWLSRTAAALGNGSSNTNSKMVAAADVLQLLLLERPDADAAGPASCSSNGRRQGVTCLSSLLLALVASVTKEAAAAASSAVAEGEADGGCRSCSPDIHLFGALLLLSCPQQWVARHFCALACGGHPAFSLLLLQPDCLDAAVSLSGTIARSFVRTAATHLLLLQQQHLEQPQLRLLQRRQHQLLFLHAAACVIDMYEPSLLEECHIELQREGRSSSLLLQRLPFYKQLLMQRLFSVSAQHRQGAAAALRQLLHLPPLQGSDPGAEAVRVWQERGRSEWQRLRLANLQWEEEEVSVLCAAAGNDRLSPSTRAQSLQTLLVCIHSNVEAAYPFIRRLCIAFLSAASQQQLLQPGDAAFGASATTPELIVASLEAPADSFLLSLVQLVRSLPQQGQQQQLLLPAAAQTLAMPLLLLASGDPLLQALIGVYRHLLNDSLLLHSLCGSGLVSLSCLQLCSLLLFHPQQSMLLPHRICPLGPQLESLLTHPQQEQQQQQQQQRQVPSLVLPAWLALRIELPLDTETLDLPSAAQAAWAQRSEDSAFLVARQLAGVPALLELASAAAAAACRRLPFKGLCEDSDGRAEDVAPLQGDAVDSLQLQEQSHSKLGFGRRASSSSFLPARRRLPAVQTPAGAPSPATQSSCFCVLSRQSAYPAYPAISFPSGSNWLSAIARPEVSLSRQAVQRLLQPTHPELEQLIHLICNPPLQFGVLPVRHQRQRLGSGDTNAALAAAASPSGSGVGGSVRVDVAAYTEALQCCRQIAAALQLPGDCSAVWCCLFAQGRETANPLECSHCCSCLSAAAAKGLSALALAVKRYVYSFLQQLSQQVAEAVIEEQEAAGAFGQLPQQFAEGSSPRDCRSEIDVLLLGTQLLVELLPLAAEAGAPRDSPSIKSSTPAHPPECCRGWLALPNVSQFCGSLLGISTQLPLLRRTALQLAVLTLRHSLPPLSCNGSGSSSRSKQSLFYMPGDDVWMQQPIVLLETTSRSGANEDNNSSVLLQLQLQQLLQLACSLAPAGDLSLQDQQPICHALLCLDVCVRRNSFAAVAAAAAEAAAEWQMTEAAGGSLEQQQQLLDSQLALLQGQLSVAHPEVRLAAWRCLRGCLSSWADLLVQQPYQQDGAARANALVRLYASICPVACQQVLNRRGPLPGGFCARCPSSLAEASEALRCLAALRCCSGSTSSAAAATGGAHAAVAAAVAALDEWTASETFVHRILGGFLPSSSSGGPRNVSSNSSAFSHGMGGRAALRGLTAGLELLCCAVRTHAKPLLRLLFEQQHSSPRSARANDTTANTISNDTDGAGDVSGSIMSSIIRAVSPRRLALPLSPADRPAGRQEVASAAAAAVAAVGTPEAEAAFGAAVASLQASRADKGDVRKCCRALRLLLDLAEATDFLNLLLLDSSTSMSRAADAAGNSSTSAAAAAGGRCSSPLFVYIEDLIQAAALLLLTSSGCPRSRRSSTDSTSSEEVVGCSQRGSGAAANLRRRQATAEVVRQVLLLLLRLFALVHPQTIRDVAKQLQGETSALGPLLQQQEELQHQQQHWQQQQALDFDLLQTLQEPQKKEAAAAAAAAKDAALGLWASPSLWLLVVCSLGPFGGHSDSALPPALLREATTLAVCLLQLSYQEASRNLQASREAPPAAGALEGLWEQQQQLGLPALLPPLPSNHLHLYCRVQRQQQQQPLLLPADPLQAQGLFSAVAAALLQQLRCRSLAAACAVSVHQQTTCSGTPLRRHSTTGASLPGAAASPRGSTSGGRGRSSTRGRYSSSPVQHQRLAGSSCCSSPLNTSQVSLHSVAGAAAGGEGAGENNGWPQQLQNQRNRLEHRNSCLLHTLGEALLLLFAGHPTAATAAAWTRFIPLADGNRKQEALLLPAHFIRSLECLVHGAAAASLLNFTASLGAQRPPQKSQASLPHHYQQQQQVHQQHDEWQGETVSLLNSRQSSRSCGNLLLHRVLLLLQLLSASATCTPDGFAAAAAVDRSLPFGAVVAAARALWRLCSLQQCLLTLVQHHIYPAPLLHFLHRCVRARDQMLLLPTRSNKNGRDSLQLLHSAETLLRLRLEESGILAALIDSVCNSLGTPRGHTGTGVTNTRPRQQKLPPRLLRSVLLTLQHTIDGVQDGSLVLQLLRALTADVRPRLQQLLQRSTSRRHTTSGLNTSSTRCVLNSMDVLQLSGELRCMGAAAAATADDPKVFAVLFRSNSEGTYALPDRPKECLEDFVAPLLLPDLPLQLVASLLHFFVSLTAAGEANLSLQPPHLLGQNEPLQHLGGEAIVVGSGKRRPLPQGALRIRFLLQHSPSFAPAVVFLLMVKLTQEDCLILSSEDSDAQQQLQHQQSPFGIAALRDALLLLHSVFLTDIRSASKLKQHVDAIRNALSNWQATVQQHLHRSVFLPKQQPAEPEQSLLHMLTNLLVGAIRALNALG